MARTLHADATLRIARGARARLAFALLWAVMVHGAVALLYFADLPPQGRPGPGAGLEIRLGRDAGARSAPAAQASRGQPAVAADDASLQAGGLGGDAYLASVRGRLAAQKARVSGSGEVIVQMSIGAGGVVADVRVERGSGDASLDAAALDLVRRASPLPPPPRAMRISVPIRFGADRAIRSGRSAAG